VRQRDEEVFDEARAKPIGGEELHKITPGLVGGLGLGGRLELAAKPLLNYGMEGG